MEGKARKNDLLGAIDKGVKRLARIRETSSDLDRGINYVGWFFLDMLLGGTVYEPPHIEDSKTNSVKCTQDYGDILVGDN